MIKDASLAVVLMVMAGHSTALAQAPAAVEKPVVATHAAVTPSPRGGGWMNRHKSFNARVAKGNVDLLMIGDSITHGWEGRGKKIWGEHYANRNAVN